MTPRDRHASLQKKDNEEDLDEAEVRELDALTNALRLEQWESEPELSCCQPARDFPAVAFVVDSLDDAEPIAGRWVIQIHGSDRAHLRGDREWYLRERPAPKFCPYCAAPLPAMRRKPVPPAPLRVVEDGGFYCSTCEERLIACLCLPSEAAFEPTP